MPRRVSSRIHDYYIFDTNKSICQLPNKEGFICNAAIKGKHAGNLEKHVKTWHEEEWKHYWNDKERSLNTPTNKESSTTLSTHFVNVDFSYLAQEENFVCQSFASTKRRRTTSTPCTKIPRNSDTFTTEIENALVELVAVNGVPFSIVEESGFKKILSLAFIATNNEGTVTREPTTRSRLQKLVKQKAESIRSYITETIKNKLISLRIDCAIIEKKHIFGIGVYFRNAQTLQVFNLAILSLSQDHTQDILKEEILNVLVEYGIQIDQIYYVLVTNCSQALKVSAKSDDAENDLNKSTLIQGKTEFSEYIEYDSDFDIFEVEETELDPEEEEQHEIECDEDVNNDEATEILVDDVIKCWSQEPHINVGKSLNCAFQRAVLDTLEKENAAKALLAKIRNIVRKLRSSVYTRQLKSLRCKKKTILDSKTRLLSSYDMLQRFMELKPYLDQLSASATELEISLKEWNLLMDVVDSLKPLKSANNRLFSKDIPLSEFYKIWITCFLKTKKIGTPFSLNLCKNMDKQKSWLLSNITFKSCLYLDPRFKNTLSSKDQEEVIAHLTALYDRISASLPTSLEDTEAASLCTVKLERMDGDEDDELYNYVQSMVKTPIKQRKNNSNVGIALQAFTDSEPLLEIRNVPSFWQEKKHLYAEVYELSQIILSVPAANAFLDVFVSQFKFILNAAKNGIDSRLLKDAILVRSNFQLASEER